MAGVRWWIIARTPTVLIDYLFEILIIGVTGLVGLSFLTGFSTSNLTRQLPEAVVLLFGGVYVLGAATAAVGMLWRRIGTVLPAALKLLAFAFVAYVVAAIGFVGFRGAMVTGLMAGMLATLAAWRSFLLRSTYLLLKERPIQEAGDEAKS